MSSEPVRWGVLGTGLIARAHVIAALQGADRCELVGIASRSEETARTVAAEHGIPEAYGSYEQLLAAPHIDCVYLPLPNHLHEPWIHRAIAAGKHVLCEKPLTLTSEQAANVARHAAERGVIVMEAFMYRFHPAWERVQSLIAGGAIGRLTDVSVWFSFRSTRPTDYRHEATTGGGALYDVGCYAVDVTRTLLGDDPHRVLGTARMEAGVDMTFSGILDYGDAFATFTCSMDQEPQHSVVIHGTGGWISIADPFNCPPDHETTVAVGTGGHHHPHDSSVVTHTIEAANQYGLQATALGDAIRNGTPSPLPLEDSVANMRLLERLFAASDIVLPGPEIKA